MDDQLSARIMLIAIHGVLVFDLAFIVIMHGWIPWRRNAWGRHVMAFSYALALPIVLGLARLWFGDYPYRWQVLAVSYVALMLAMGHQVWLVVNERFIRPRRVARMFDRSNP
jgi:hypothetical protein